MFCYYRLWCDGKQHTTLLVYIIHILLFPCTCQKLLRYVLLCLTLYLPNRKCLPMLVIDAAIAEINILRCHGKQHTTWLVAIYIHILLFPCTCQKLLRYVLLCLTLYLPNRKCLPMLVIDAAIAEINILRCHGKQHTTWLVAIYIYIVVSMYLPKIIKICSTLFSSVCVSQQCDIHCRHYRDLFYSVCRSLS